MSPRSRSVAGVGEGRASVATNEVVLVGRLSGAAQERELPSGDVLATFRVVVDRGEDGRGRQPVDTLECVAWTPRLRRAVATWRTGDVVRVEGSVRRRFFRTGPAVSSRVEVEALRARIIRRAATS